MPTPFPSWNRICGEEGGEVGIGQGWVSVLAGEPGSGKSTLAYNCIGHAWLNGYVGGVINYEMSVMQAVTRTVAMMSRVPKREISQGARFKASTWKRARDQVSELREKGGGMIVSEPGNSSVDAMERAFDDLKRAEVDFIVVDYAQLVYIPGVNGIGQRSEIAALSITRKAHELDVATLALSQLNREGVKGGEPPNMHTLLGGMAWEANAHQVLNLDFTHRMFSDDRSEEWTRLFVAKNRHGPAFGMIPLHWDHRTDLIEEYEPTTGYDPEDEPDEQPEPPDP